VGSTVPVHQEWLSFVPQRSQKVGAEGPWGAQLYRHGHQRSEARDTVLGHMAAEPGLDTRDPDTGHQQCEVATPIFPSPTVWGGQDTGHTEHPTGFVRV
jgi:hypothetical protein